MIYLGVDHLVDERFRFQIGHRFSKLDLRPFFSENNDCEKTPFFDKINFTGILSQKGGQVLSGRSWVKVDGRRDEHGRSYAKVDGPKK